MYPNKVFSHIYPQWHEHIIQYLPVIAGYIAFEIMLSIITFPGDFCIVFLLIYDVYIFIKILSAIWCTTSRDVMVTDGEDYSSS